MKPWIYTLVVAVVLVAALGYVAYMYMATKAQLSDLKVVHSSLLAQVYSRILGLSSMVKPIQVNLTAVYASHNGYAVVFTFINPSNTTQYLMELDVASLPFSTLSYYVGNVAIPPMSRVNYTIWLYVNKSAYTVTSIYNINQISGGSEAIVNTMFGPVYYAPAYLPGLSVILSYYLPNGRFVTRSYIINVSNIVPVINNTIYAEAYASNSWATYVLLTYMAAGPFYITGYSLLSPNGTTILSCTSTVSTIYPNGTVVDGVMLPMGQFYLPLANASTVTTTHYWVGYWSSMRFNSTSYCKGKYTLFVTPTMGYVLKLYYTLPNGQSATMAIPVKFYTTSSIIWG